jgi:translation initiation factor 1
MAVTGLVGGDAELEAILKRCKTALGVGGSREGRVLFVQGEDRERLRAELARLGIPAKLAGG